MNKYIFVTGGVVSSVGKGITAASIARLIKSRGISVCVQKLDPYINVDPGTMSPYQHGEVFVTGDGAETDLDLGHYERFVDIDLTTYSSVTTGQIYSSVITRERRGDFLGGTIQVIPHITNEIKERIFSVGKQTGAEVTIVEVGGTVGDIEGLPFLEAIRQMRHDVGRENVVYVHVTLLPYISSTGELKTKPTQHSVNELRRIGIQPDIIICRSDYPVQENLRDKIALFGSVEKRAVIPLVTMPLIYEVPIVLEDAGIADLLLEFLKISPGAPDMAQWRAMVQRMKQPKQPLPIAIVGKYVELKDAYISVREALIHAAAYHNREAQILWVHSEALEKEDPDNYLKTAQGIIVPGGFGYRGIEGMIQAARYAREKEIPYLGLCLGMQIMVIEMGRHVLNTNDVHSTEFDEHTAHPVICLLSEQQQIYNKGGTMRLGAYPCHLVNGTRAAKAYGQSVVYERHRHRYEFNNDYREMLEKGGLIASGLSPDGNLVEIAELKGHPWMTGVQFHAEFSSRPERPHPLFKDFVEIAAKTMREGAQPPLPLR